MKRVLSGKAGVGAAGAAVGAVGEAATEVVVEAAAAAAGAVVVTVATATVKSERDKLRFRMAIAEYKRAAVCPASTLQSLSDAFRPRISEASQAPCGLDA